MGKIKSPDDIMDVSGRLGNKVIADTKYGKQVKKLPEQDNKIVQPDTKEVTDWAYVSREYDKLTEAEATMWARYANTREIRQMYSKERYLQGRNLFFSINMKLLEIGEPIIRKIPLFKSAQMFFEMSLELRGNVEEIDIIFNFSPEINEDTKLIIKSSGPVKENLLFIHPSLYKKLLIADHSFISGSSLREVYLHNHQQMPVEGQKIGFLFETVNRNCGTANIPVKINAHLDSLKSL